MTVIKTIMNEITEVMTLVDEIELEQGMTYLKKDVRIFITGAGRSGFQAKGFAMRLMHIGYTVFVLGETVTPSLNKGDVLVAISGSGTTQGILFETEFAISTGVNVLALTSDRTSKLAELADATIIIPGATKTGAGIKSEQLLSSLFDQTVHITLDALCLMLARRDKTSNESALNSHVNIE